MGSFGTGFRSSDRWQYFGFLMLDLAVISKILNFGGRGEIESGVGVGAIGQLRH